MDDDDDSLLLASLLNDHDAAAALTATSPDVDTQSPGSDSGSSDDNFDPLEAAYARRSRSAAALPSPPQ